MGVMKAISLDLEETLAYIDKKLADASDVYKEYFIFYLKRELNSRIKCENKSKKQEATKRSEE